MTHKLMEDGAWYKNAAGLYVQSEPIDRTLVAAGSEGDAVTVAADGSLEVTNIAEALATGGATGDVLCVDSSGGVEPKTLTAGTDITITHGAGTITVAASGGGGGGGGLASPDDVPASPNTEDDEFDTSTLAGKWTETLSGATSDIDTTIPSHYALKVTGNQTMTLRQSYTAASTFAVTAAISAVLLDSNQLADLFVTDDTSQTNGIYLRIKNGTVQFLNRTSGSSTAVATISPVTTGRNYLHVARSGTTFSAWWSKDGRGWHRIGTVTKTLSVAYLWLQYSSSGSTAVHDVGYDWIRRDWITL